MLFPLHGQSLINGDYDRGGGGGGGVLESLLRTVCISGEHPTNRI